MPFWIHKLLIHRYSHIFHYRKFLAFHRVSLKKPSAFCSIFSTWLCLLLLLMGQTPLYVQISFRPCAFVPFVVFGATIDCIINPSPTPQNLHIAPSGPLVVNNAPKAFRVLQQNCVSNIITMRDFTWFMQANRCPGSKEKKKTTTYHKTLWTAISQHSNMALIKDKRSNTIMPEWTSLAPRKPSV